MPAPLSQSTFYMPITTAPVGFCDVHPFLNDQQQLQQQQQPTTLSVTSSSIRESSNLYVSLLPEEVGDAEMHDLFAPFGPIDSAVVMRNIHTGVSRGIAFVQYQSRTSASEALEALHGHEIRPTRRIGVEYANKPCPKVDQTNRVFIRNLPKAVTETELREKLMPYGTILKITFHPDRTEQHNAQQPLIPDHLRQQQHPLIDTTTMDSAELMLRSSDSVATNGQSSSSSSGGGNKKIVFVTFQTRAQAKAAAVAMHNATPFPSCGDVPLLAKVAESNARRQERHQKKIPAGGPDDESQSPLSPPPSVLPTPSVVPMPMPLSAYHAGSGGSILFHPQSSMIPITTTGGTAPTAVIPPAWLPAPFLPAPTAATTTVPTISYMVPTAQWMAVSPQAPQSYMAPSYIFSFGR